MVDIFIIFRVKYTTYTNYYKDVIYNVFVVDRVRGIFDVLRVIRNSLINLTGPIQT